VLMCGVERTWEFLLPVTCPFLLRAKMARVPCNGLAFDSEDIYDTMLCTTSNSKGVSTSSEVGRLELSQV
jgi:hypothetical protein